MYIPYIIPVYIIPVLFILSIYYVDRLEGWFPRISYALIYIGYTQLLINYNII